MTEELEYAFVVRHLAGGRTLLCSAVNATRAFETFPETARGRLRGCCRLRRFGFGRFGFGRFGHSERLL
jgi:hypothetical protein